MKEFRAFCALALFGIGLHAQTAYWPLAKGANWQLKSKNVATPMAFAVEDDAAGIYRVRWDNPWIKTTFYFRSMGAKILLAKLDMGAGVGQMPPQTVYFDFDQPKNSSWHSAAGTMTVVDRSRTVRAPAGEYRDCITIRAKGGDGSETFWTFAPGVGVVQFGEGSGAFLLVAAPAGRLAASAPPNVIPSAPVVSGHPPAHHVALNRLLIGIDANPAPQEGFGQNALQSSFRKAVNAGMTFTKIHPKWQEIEKSPGRYDFGDFAAHSKRASENGIPIYLGIRTIDTARRSLPSAYSSWKWDDPRMAEKLTALLEAIHAKFSGEIRWVAIGNEVDGYFKGHNAEIAAYATLLQRITPTIHRLWPNATVSANFTWDAASETALYRPIFDAVQDISYTYYPLNPDFTVKSPDEVAAHLQKLVDSAGGRPVILQEVGYPSGSANNSSPAKQARFVQNAIREARRLQDRIVAMNFVWMSDIPDSVVDGFAKYYQLPNADKFKSFLATLGFVDKDGNPKESWNTFNRESRDAAMAR